MTTIEPPPPARGADLLIEHCAALDTSCSRLSANERLERMVGGSLARLLVGALQGPRGSRRDDLDPEG